MKKIVILDFDKTITTKDTFNDFLISTFGKTKFNLCILKNSFNIFLYKSKFLNNSDIKTKLLTFFYKNIPYSKYESDCKNYAIKIPNLIRKDILELLKFYKENDYELVILSASFKEWIEPWAKEFGFNKVICSIPEIKDNHLTGVLKEENSCYGKNKVDFLTKEYPNLKDYDRVIAYGDSKNDKYFMDLADTKYLVKKENIEMQDEYALVTDGLWRKSLSAIRSLGKKGIKVIVTGDTYLSTGMHSRFCYQKKKVNKINNEEEFKKDMLNILDNSPKKPVLFPMEESTILWCSNNYDLIKDKCYILIPPKESLDIALSKSLTIKQAIKEKIPCPKTYFPKNSKELTKLIKEENLDDYVIKPYHGSGSSGLLYGANSKNVDLEAHWQTHGELILQERIPSSGEGVGVSVIMDKNGEEQAYFAHKRLEQYPNSGGPSTQRIGLENQDLVKKSIKLLKSLNWVGVAMVEWKYNPNTKEYVLMEINPRFWGSLELAVRSGVDFPYLYYELAKNREVKKVTTYDTNYNCRWLIPGDILRYLTKDNKESLRKFLKNSLKNSEEWDKQDKRGFFANIWCQGLLVINPKYWKYIRK